MRWSITRSSCVTFTKATPIDQIDRLNSAIGSRPARRKATQSTYDLRGIPWVFAWTHTCVVPPSWYGVGSALAGWVNEAGAEAAPNRLETLSSRYKEWPFFRIALDNVQLGLARADMHIASLMPVDG